MSVKHGIQNSICNRRRFLPEMMKLAVMSILFAGLNGCAMLGLGGSKTPDKEPIVLNEKEMMEFTKLFFDGNKAKILGDYGQAKKHFTDALRINPESGATKFEIAKLYAEQRRFTDALQLAKGARESDRENIWYAHFLAQLYAETSDLDQSTKIFREIIAAQPKEYENYFNLANLLSARGKYEEALEVYEELTAMTGPNEEISVQKQIIYLEKEDYDMALAEVTALIDANPEEVRYYGMKAEILQHMDRPEDALELYEIMLFENPENGLVLMALFELYEKKGNTEKSENYLVRAFESADLGIDVKVNILLDYLSAQNLEKRSEFILSLGTALEKVHPKEAKSFAIQGDIYYNLDSLETARKKFKQAVDLDANRPPIWQQILTIDSRLNDFDAMVEAGEQAVELFPMQPLFYLFYGVAQLGKENNEKAIETLETGLALVIDNDEMEARFHTSLGDAYHAAGLHDKSDKAYDESLELDGNNALVLNNYAYYLSVREKRLEKAETMAKKANNLVPDQASFQDTYGWVLYKRGNYQNAKFWIEEALKNGGDKDPVVLDHFGDVLKALGQKAEAVRWWQQAIDEGGDPEEILPKINSESIGE
ncbi:MAG: tetratricopeptide repeat protein [Cryomorphaceae bacterium]